MIAEIKAYFDTRLDAFKDELRVELMALHLGDDKTITEAEASRILGISESKLRQLRAASMVPCGYIGKSPRYSLAHVREIERAIARGDL